MTDDFVGDLERQLREAAARRARRRPRAPGAAGRRPRAPGAARLAVACLLLLVALAAGLLLAGGDGDRGAAEEGARRPEVSVALPAALPARTCPGLEQRTIPAGGEPSRASLGVFARDQVQPDGLPAVDGVAGLSWLPAATVLPAQARRPGLDAFAAEVHLVPSLGVRADGRCEPSASLGDGPGVCLTAGAGRGVAVRCFPDEAVAAGRAVALTGGLGGRPAGQVHGIAPDGVRRVVLRGAGGRAEARVVENAYEARLPGVRAGDELTLRFALAAPRAACAPSPALLAAVPALRGEPAGARPPAQLADVLGMDPGLTVRWARVWRAGPRATVWLVPRLRCALVTENDRACLAIEARFVEGAVCARAAEIGERGASDWFPVGGRPLVAGFAPEGARAAVVRVPGGVERRLGVRGGVFAGALSASVRMDRPGAYRVTFEG